MSKDAVESLRGGEDSWTNFIRTNYELHEAAETEPCLHEHLDVTGCCNDCGLLLLYEEVEGV